MSYPEGFPEEWKGLPDDQVTPCGYPLGYVYPDLYDENNQPRTTFNLARFLSYVEGED